MNFISVSDISPIGAAGSGNACFDCNSGDVGAVEEYIWRSDPMTLAGNIAPTNGEVSYPPSRSHHTVVGVLFCQETTPMTLSLVGGGKRQQEQQRFQLFAWGTTYACMPALCLFFFLVVFYCRVTVKRILP